MQTSGRSTPIHQIGPAVMLIASWATTGIAIAQQTPPRDDDAKSVTVTAEGYNDDDALKQALRKALEQGAGAQIAAYSEVRDFALARDTIYSRAFGIVRDYRIVSRRETPSGTIEVTVEATVRASAVAQAWGEVQNLLDQIGRPKILVWIDETIDGRLESESIVESRLQEMLVKAGFDVVERRAIDDIARREAADAERSGDREKLRALAKNAGAHIYVRGSANANRAGVEDLYGVRAAFYNCDVQARVYYTDTGRLLASESLPSTRAGVRSQREFSPQAARSALAQAALPPDDARRDRPYLARKLYESIMEQWSIQLTAGGEIALEAAGVGFSRFLKLKRALSEIANVDSVNADFTNGTGQFRIRAKISAETLAERLTEPPFEEWIEVTDLKPNRIQARAK